MHKGEIQQYLSYKFIRFLFVHCYCSSRSNNGQVVVYVNQEGIYLLSSRERKQTGDNYRL